MSERIPAADRAPDEHRRCGALRPRTFAPAPERAVAGPKAGFRLQASDAGDARRADWETERRRASTRSSLATAPRIANSAGVEEPVPTAPAVATVEAGGTVTPGRGVAGVGAGVVLHRIPMPP